MHWKGKKILDKMEKEAKDWEWPIPFFFLLNFFLIETTTKTVFYQIQFVNTKSFFGAFTNDTSYTPWKLFLQQLVFIGMDFVWK